MREPWRERTSYINARGVLDFRRERQPITTTQETTQSKSEPPKMLSKYSRTALLCRGPFRPNVTGTANRNFSVSRVSLLFETMGAAFFYVLIQRGLQDPERCRTRGEPWQV